MKSWEVLKALEEGKKVRKRWWGNCSYIKMIQVTEKKVVCWENGDEYSLNDDLFFEWLEEEWELYEEVEEVSASEFKDLAQNFHTEEMKKEEEMKEKRLKEIKPKIDKILQEAKEEAVRGEYQYKASIVVNVSYDFTLMKEHFEKRGFKVEEQEKITIEYFDATRRHELFNGMDYCYKYYFILSWE